MIIPLTREQFEFKKQELSALGIIIKGDSGTITHQGVTAEYRYQPVISLLVVTVTSRPFLISQAAVEDRIRLWFRDGDPNLL